MQALRVTIPGDYWDVQIYRGWLHVWTMSGSLITIDWDGLVDELAESATSALAVRLGLAQGSVLYGRQVAPLRVEREFREWMLSRFDAQAQQLMAASRSDVARATIDEQTNPLSGLPVDTEIYERMLYAATDTGLWRASVGRTVHPVSTRLVKLHDLPAVSMRARSRQLALAASGDGLFSLGLDGNRNRFSGMSQLSDRHCERVDWAFQSIFASSTLSGGYLYSRYWQPRPPNEVSEYTDDGSRLIDGGVFDDTSIVGSLTRPDVSWAQAEKIFTAGMQHLTASLYTQKEVPNGITAASAALGEVVLANATAQAIAGGSAPFGTIVEFDDSLIIVLSDEEQFSIDGPVTRWRTYPRAVNYENHLHVIFDDHLEIFAFYGDYFVDQDRKLFGTKSPTSTRVFVPLW